MLGKRERTWQSYQKALSPAAFLYLLKPIQNFVASGGILSENIPFAQSTKHSFLHCSSTSHICLPFRKLRGSCENGSGAGCETTLLGCKALKPSIISMISGSLIWICRSNSTNITLHVFFNVCKSGMQYQKKRCGNTSKNSHFKTTSNSFYSETCGNAFPPHYIPAAHFLH